MDNQHKKIKGYRDLSQEEIDLMNRLKEAGQVVSVLLELVKIHVEEQRQLAIDCGNVAEINRLDETEPEKWLATAKTDMQTGLMAAIRAVAQPETF